MDMNEYQRKVIKHLRAFLATLKQHPDMRDAFREYWAERGATKMPAYKNNVKGVPHVCVKVPTAGGKTFIAVNALTPIFDLIREIDPQRPQMVAWLVPSLTILEQTYRQLDDPQHPYRRCLNLLFNGRVAVYQKQDLLTAANFSADTAQGQLSIVVMSFDSLRARNKDDRKIFQGNGNLASFLSASWYNADNLLPDHEPDSLINVLRQLRPVVVVDESHNAESALSVEMLGNLNPVFILDLTATPRNNSNIISYVDAMQLKNQHMVKLPVIVSNQPDKNRVIENAINMRRDLENLAIRQEKAGGKYIRPIVLFQAQPRTADDNTTFEKLRGQLLELQIPAEQIKIKTAQINELKDTDLLSRDCPVRYIITVNALKEGWDCPFAYILASLADKSASVDVEQILGRVLRMPYVQNHAHDLLNMSYVFTSSSRFMETLENIVKALNRAGFSQRDFRVAAPKQPESTPLKPTDGTTLPLNLNPPTPDKTDDADDDTIDPSKIDVGTTTIGEIIDDDTTPNTSSINPQLDDFKAQAEEASRKYEEEAKKDPDPVPEEQERHMNRQKMQERYQEQVSKLQLPQFFMNVKKGGLIGGELTERFERNWSLTGFRLVDQATEIKFEIVEEELRRIDLVSENKTGEDDDYRAVNLKIDKETQNKLHELIMKNPLPSQQRHVSSQFVRGIGKQDPITEAEIKAYVERIVGGFTKEQIAHALANESAYIRKIKETIKTHSTRYIEKQFYRELDVESIFIKPSYTLPASITPKENSPPIHKSLYQLEELMGSFEKGMIGKIADLDNVLWWHKNSSSKGFHINGCINHYPDFIIQLNSGKVILLEAKGDDRDNSDSAAKLKLGKAWETATGREFRYMMVFNNKAIEGAHNLADALKDMGRL